MPRRRSGVRLALAGAALLLLYAACPARHVDSVRPRSAAGTTASDPLAAPLSGRSTADPTTQRGESDAVRRLASDTIHHRRADESANIASASRARRPAARTSGSRPHDASALEAGRPALPTHFQTSIPETPPEPAWAPARADEPALYELQLGRLARRVVEARQSERGPLLPMAAFLALAEIGHRAAGPRISGRLEPDGERFALDAETREVRVGRRVVVADSADLVAIDGAAYGSLALLRQLFGLSAVVDHEGAAIFVYNPDRLPIARRLERDAARAIVIGGPRAAAPDLVVRGRGGAWDGLVMAYEFRSSSHDPARETAYDVGVATGVADGSLLLRTRGVTGHAAQLEGAWTGIWPHRRWLTQLRIGDGVVTGPRPEASRGVSVTNAPFARPLLVEDMPFAGSLPPDWSVEAYRGGQLLGFDSVDQSGRYLLTLPVQYGENAVDIVAYGPFGEVRTFNRTFRALPSMLPPGAFEYGLSGGACRSSRCTANGNLDLRYGVSRRLTARAGLDRFWRDGASAVSHPYGSFVAAPTNALALEAEGVVGALVRAGIRVEPSLGLRLTADYVDYADSAGSSPFVPPGARRQWAVSGRVVPSPRTASVVLEAEGTRTETTASTRTEVRAGVAVRMGAVQLRPYARGEHLTGAGRTTRRYAGLEATALPRASLGPVLGRIWAHGRVEAEDAHRPTRASLSLARNLGRGFRVETGARWERGFPGAVLTLSLVSQLDAIRSTSLVTAPTTGESARLDQSIGGSVVWSRGADVALSSEPALDRGGIAGRVFLDVNADGRRQDDEPVLPGTRVLVANRWRTADAEGRFQVWGLSPYEEVLVMADSTSLASPWWVPAFGSASVLPPPNAYSAVDLPVMIGGVVEGSVVFGGSTAAPSEVPPAIVLIETTTGVRTTVETFSDGSFYRMGLRRGRYLATVDGAMLASPDVVADTVRFTLEPQIADAGGPPGARREAARQASGPVVSGLRIELRLNRALAARRPADRAASPARQR